MAIGASNVKRDRAPMAGQVATVRQQRLGALHVAAFARFDEPLRGDVRLVPEQQARARVRPALACRHQRFLRIKGATAEHVCYVPGNVYVPTVARHCQHSVQVAFIRQRRAEQQLDARKEAATTRRIHPRVRVRGVSTVREQQRNAARTAVLEGVRERALLLVVGRVGVGAEREQLGPQRAQAC
eukprot:scaffold311625_cov31-Tisochrysis_lutea.AAC.1